MEEEAPTYRECCQSDFPEESVSSWETFSNNEKVSDCVTDLSQSSTHSESPNEFVRAERGLEEENTSYQEELGRVVDRQAQKEFRRAVNRLTREELKRAVDKEAQEELRREVDRQTREELERAVNKQAQEELRREVDRQTREELKIAVEKQAQEELRREVDRQTREELKRAVDRQTQNEFKRVVDRQAQEQMADDGREGTDGRGMPGFTVPNPEVKIKEDSTVPYQQGRLYGCNTSDCSSETQDHEGSSFDTLQTSAESNQLEDVDLNSSLPTCWDFQNCVVATTRQLLKQAVLSSNDRMFCRSGPRKVSVGLARPLRQPQVTGKFVQLCKLIQTAASQRKFVQSDGCKQQASL
jgi:hypothetical protein